MKISTKNIHLIPTDKPSRLWVNNLLRRFELDSEELIGSNTAQHIYITYDEEIKDCYALTGIDEVVKVDKSNEELYHNFNCKKIILTTDPDLIKDGVQAIDDEFLEWFVKNPSCKWVEIKNIKTIPSLQLGNLDGHLMYKIIIPKVLTKLEIAKNIAAIGIGKKEEEAKRIYSEEDMIEFLVFIENNYYYNSGGWYNCETDKYSRRQELLQTWKDQN